MSGGLGGGIDSAVLVQSVRFSESVVAAGISGNFFFGFFFRGGEGGQGGERLEFLVFRPLLGSKSQALPSSPSAGFFLGEVGVEGMGILEGGGAGVGGFLMRGMIENSGILCGLDLGSQEGIRCSTIASQGGRSRGRRF